MYNFVTVIGKLTDEPKIIELENGRKEYLITLAINQPFKNNEGINEVDIIDCTISYGLADRINEYCKKGSIVGVKGRLGGKSENGQNIMKVIGERVSFISQPNKNKNKDIER